MRRKDREVTDPVRIDTIIQTCDCCRLGFSEKNGAYILPLNFAYTRLDGQPQFYFHCAKAGRKLELLAQNANVGFELDTNHTLVSGDAGCDFSFRYQSVIGTGTLEAIDMIDEKKELARSIIGAGESWITELSNEELAELVALSRDAVDAGEVS